MTVGTPVCFEVIPQTNTTVEPKGEAQFYNAFLDVVGVPGDIKLDNITIYTFLYPILSPDSLEKSNQIWCSSDKAKAWNDWMQDNKPLTGKSDCDTTAVRKSVELGRKLAITGTPTLFFADGERVPGAVPIAQIEKKLGEIDQAAQ